MAFACPRQGNDIAVHRTYKLDSSLTDYIGKAPRIKGTVLASRDVECTE